MAALFGLIDCFVKAKDGDREEAESQGRHGGHLRPQDFHAYALEICATQYNQKIAQGDEVSEVLQPLRHGGDGKSES